MTLKKWVSSKTERWTLKRILIVFSSSIVGIMTLLLISVMQANHVFYNQLNQDLSQLVNLQSKTEEIEAAYHAIRSYTLSDDMTYLTQYEDEKEDLLRFFEGYKLKDKGSNPYYLYYDAYNMFLSFTEQAVRSLTLFEEGAEPLYVNHQVLQLSKNKNFMKEQLEKMIAVELVEIKNKYGDIEAATASREELIYVIIFFIITFTLWANHGITNKLSRPIHALSVQLKNIANGDYNRDPIQQSSIGELHYMIVRFNKMKVKLADNIDLMHENAKIREQLKNQEIELLETENHLKQSKLDYLQSQINPHFLYNTLNSIQTLADIEEAPLTEKMLFHMSSLMRYNQKKMNDIVRLKEELDIVDSYIYIQMIRFGNRIQYIMDKDDDALNTLVPSMILQPLVENAMIHGLEPKIGQGVLKIEIYKEPGQVVVSVYDNGVGMDQETMDNIMLYAESDPGKNGIKSYQSIGLSNVIRRCMLYYGKNILEIQSEKGHYTQLKLVIPDKE
ncbi:sensor histidine kinase [Vallitalea pronyensis]|uniref:Sensor histidine kinase n=1 Tax=Vallitalea pronyensis TaxID=1348613 RepID=A0A8J8SG74_9FIRM|nr:histidine kinase [Vallitalea pronyensis]QUI22465.1 sensor histidine kinase [Vallitalea pronyensis]